jgi:tRNA uridine 5-carboxymethylaminomethyl modification enzyme
MRLREKGYKLGLVREEQYRRFLEKKDRIEKEIVRLENVIVPPSERVNEILEREGTSLIKTGVKLIDLLKRPEINYKIIKEIEGQAITLERSEVEQVEVHLKYEGYINKQLQQAQKVERLENKQMPEDINYNEIKGLSLESRQKLTQIKPISIGQASRISGVSPADITVLLIFLEQVNRMKNSI